MIWHALGWSLAVAASVIGLLIAAIIWLGWQVWRALQ